MYGVGPVKTNKYKYKLFYKQNFCKQQQAEIGKNQAKANRLPEAELVLCTRKMFLVRCL